MGGIFRRRKTDPEQVRLQELKKLENLANDIAVFEEMAQIYTEQADTLDRLKQDEKAVLDKLSSEGPDAGMELLNGTLKSYSPHLKAEWSQE